jgi:hypothetical protein
MALWLAVVGIDGVESGGRSSFSEIIVFHVAFVTSFANIRIISAIHST